MHSCNINKKERKKIKKWYSASGSNENPANARCTPAIIKKIAPQKRYPSSNISKKKQNKNKKKTSGEGGRVES